MERRGRTYLRSEMPNSTNWGAEAACKDGDTSIFFPVSDSEAGPAKAICRGCPVQTECLEFALQTGQDNGVWGGTNETERRRLARRRRLERARYSA